MLHTSFRTIPSFLQDAAPANILAQSPASNDSGSRLLTDDEPQCSFTDEFLLAVHARLQALEMMDDTDGPFPDPTSISAQPTFVQQLHAMFETARPIEQGTGHKIESWYTDHLRRQRCHNARVTTLGPDFRTWEQQRRFEWIDQVDPYHELDFVLVHPMPEDAEECIYAQLLLIQNPDARQRSIVLTVFDSDYDQGLPHSHAVVTTDSISLQSVLLISEFQEFCPPELPWSECRLFFEDMEVLPHQFIAAQHGVVFRLYVKRPQEFHVDALRSADDDAVRKALISPSLC